MPKTKKFTDKIKSKMPKTKTKAKKAPKASKKVANKKADEMGKMAQELANTKEQLLRINAELQNTIRRNQETVEKAHKFANTSFAKDLVNTMESLYSALDNLPKEEVANNEKFKNFADGVALTYNELKKAFDKNNIKRINPMGEKFNPDYHQAIVQVPSEAEEGTVVQVMQAGYTINDRLLRPALVGVATKIST